MIPRHWTSLAPVLTVLGAFPLQAGIPMFHESWQRDWYVWFPSTGVLQQAPAEVKVDNGVLHILDIPETDEQKDFGYVATRDGYRNYVLSMEYMWGTKKFAPRKEAKRDSGVLYHVYGGDAVWPSCMECQVQETDTGDYHLLWHADQPYMNVRVAPEKDTATGRYVFQADGELLKYTSVSVQKSQMLETGGWNQVDVRVVGNNSQHYVNGTLVNAATELWTHECVVLDEGPLGLQVEGAEILYRNVNIRPLAWPQEHAPFKVLVFSKTTGYRHASIPTGIAAIRMLGEEFGFEVDATENASAFTEANLSQYAALVFLSPTGELFNDAQKAALQGYIRAGGGFVGIHSSTNAEYDWPWYEGLVGAFFDSHPPQQNARVYLVDENATSTSSLPRSWIHWDEWYDFTSNPSDKVHVLLAVDESTYNGGKMGDGHPIAWQHVYDGGRAWITALGHLPETYREPLFLMHILGGIQYAVGLPSAL